MLTLHATPRTVTGKSAHAALKEEGLIPAVVYGPKQETVSISLPLAHFKKILRDAGESSVLELTGLGKSLQVLIHDVDVDPVTSTPRHADLYAIEKGAKVEVEVPLVFVGEAPAVKTGASLVKVMHELSIEADAANLPHEIEVDLSSLVEEGDQIHVSDLKIPAGVTVLAEATEVVALTQAVEVESEEPVATLDMDAIEVEKKGKTEGETEENV
ncbi:MAG: 50S ribosomal protein L25 [Patescibacteria group bacterium]